MKLLRFILLALILNNLVSCQSSKQFEKTISENIPTLLKGDFTDDYGIQFTINDSLWVQHPNVKYHIISWETLRTIAVGPQ